MGRLRKRVGQVAIKLWIDKRLLQIYTDKAKEQGIDRQQLINYELSKSKLASGGESNSVI